MTSSGASRGRCQKSAWPGAFLAAIVFGFAGLLFALHKLAVVTLKHIVVPDPSLAFQEVSDLLPVPRKLDWNLPFIQLLSSLREVRGPFLTLVAVAILALLGAAFVLLVRNSSGAPGRAEIRLSPDTADPDLEADTGRALLTPKAPSRKDWLPPAVLYAVTAAALATVGVPAVPDLLLRYYHTLGTFHQGYFARVAIPAVAAGVAIWAAAGLALYAIAITRRPSRERLGILMCAPVLFALAWWQLSGLRVSAMARKLDWTDSILTTVPNRSVFGVPDGLYAAQRLAKRLNLSFGNTKDQPARPVVVLMPTGIVNVVQSGFTEDGLTASEASAKPVNNYLEAHQYETALSWVAIKHLFNIATIHFNTTGAIDACMTDMERCPHLTQCGQATRTMLFTCAASPANLALVERWADERLYAHPTRESKRLIGQLYERFGEPAKALIWYRRAEMPRSFLSRIQNEQPLFHMGRITGRLLLNGKPLAGMQVGVIPRRLNGLPPDLEPAVLRARGDIFAFRPYGIFPPHHPRPYAFRWISGAAISDSHGTFAIGDLTEGEYTLVFTLPPSVGLVSPMDPRMSVAHLPPVLTLNYRAPARDLGSVEMTISK